MIDVWTLRGETPALESSHPTEDAAHAALRSLDVPALAICDGLPVGASGCTTKELAGRLRLAAALAGHTARGGVTREECLCACPGCYEPRAPYQARLAEAFRVLCREHRVMAQGIRHQYRAKGMSAEGALARLIAAAPERRHYEPRIRGAA